MPVIEALATGTREGVRTFVDTLTADSLAPIAQAAKSIHHIAWDEMLRDPVAFMAFKADEDGPTPAPSTLRACLDAAMKGDSDTIRTELATLDLQRLHSILRICLWLDHDSRTTRTTAL